MAETDRTGIFRRQEVRRWSQRLQGSGRTLQVVLEGMAFDKLPLGLIQKSLERIERILERSQRVLVLIERLLESVERVLDLVQRKLERIERTPFVSIQSPFQSFLDLWCHSLQQCERNRSIVMPISGPSSYVPTLAQFLQHWLDVNTFLGAGGPYILSDGTTLAILTGYRDGLAAFASSIQGKLNDVQIASQDVELKKIALLGRLGEYNRKMRGTLGHTVYAAALPEAPSGSAGSATILESLDDMSTLWAKVNAATIAGFTGPLKLLGGYLVATFVTELAALKTAYNTQQALQQSLDLERKHRNAMQDKAYAAMRDYRKGIAGEFAETDPLVLSLPKLTPDAGSTPDGVIVQIVWDAVLQKAKITWSASTDPNLFQFEIRFCAGPNYDTDIESVIGNVTPAELREFLTDAGLAAPGDVSSFKVYVLTTTGNEKGSNTVSITRP